jgi:hypothetical protein
MRQSDKMFKCETSDSPGGWRVESGGVYWRKELNKGRARTELKLRNYAGYIAQKKRNADKLQSAWNIVSEGFDAQN